MGCSARDGRTIRHFLFGPIWTPGRTNLLLILFGLALYLPGLGSSWVLTQHEAWAAEPAREMLADGDWLLPHYGGLLQATKPPAMHWTIAIFMAVFGSASGWVVRLPAVTAAIMTALLVAQLGRRWRDEKIALVAGLIQLTSFYVLMQARLAEGDMPLCAVVSGALLLFAWNVSAPATETHSRWRSCVFYTLIAWSALLKGPLGPAFILGGCGAFLLWQRDRRTLRFLLDPFGLAVGVLGTIAWPAAAYLVCPEIMDTWLLHTVGRFRGDMGGQEPLPFYFYMLPGMTLPWSPFAIAYVVKQRCQFLGGGWERLLLCWLFPGLVLLSLAAFKHKHYMIPLLPPVSLLAAAGLVPYLERRQAVAASRRWVTAGIIVVAGLAVTVGCGFVKNARGIDNVPIVAGCAVASMLAALAFQAKRPVLGAKLAGTFGCIGVITVAVHLFVMPAYDLYRPSRELALQVNELVPDEQPVYLVNLPRHHAIFYLDMPVLHTSDVDAIPTAEATAKDGVYVLAPASLAEKLQSRGSVATLDQMQPLPGHCLARDPLTLFRVRPTTVLAQPVSRTNTSDQLK